MNSTLVVDNKLVELQNIKSCVDGLESDLGTLKTQNHTDLGAVKSAIDSLADSIKKKLAYCFDYGLISKSLSFTENDVDSYNSYIIPSSEFEVGKSYLVRISCSDIQSGNSFLVYLPTGDFIVTNLSDNSNNVDEFEVYDYQCFQSPKLVRSGSQGGMYNDHHAVGHAHDGSSNDFYLFFVCQRCSDT